MRSAGKGHFRATSLALTKSTIVRQCMGSVRDRRLFKAVYAAVSAGIRDGSAPTNIVQAGQRLVRASQRRFVVERDGTLSEAKLRDCLNVRDGGSEDANANRFSGRAPDGAVHVGGVYFSLHNEPMFMELRHYNRDSCEVRALKNGVVLNVEVTSPMLVLDMSRHSAAAKRYLRSIESSTAFQQASGVKSISLWDRMLDANDYTVSRAIGLAAGRHRLEGVLVQTARTDLFKRSGDNVVLFGEHGNLVSTKLRIRSALLFRLRKGPGELDFTEYNF
jgi:hypothetical protein